VQEQIMIEGFPRTDALADLADSGVSIWLDDLSRELLTGGHLQRLIDHWHVVGVTTNPTIFATAVARGEGYTAQLGELAAAGTALDDVVLAVTTDDVRAACDVFAPVYRRSGLLDGRVSIEVDPRLAGDTEATTEMARRLWTAVDRPNLYVKIPATIEGLPAITLAISEGISVNVTLIFSLKRYRYVMNAYLDGLEQALAAGRDLSRIASVASFFVSRIDAAVDPLLERAGAERARLLKGSAAVANARLAFEAYEEMIATSRWAALAEAGATPQRPLWASTGVKNPDYPDTLYVTDLVTRGTVSTMPEVTLAAVADHGSVTGDTIRTRYADATDVAVELATVDVCLDEVTEGLELEGLVEFEASWAELGATIQAGLDRVP